MSIMNIYTVFFIMLSMWFCHCFTEHETRLDVNNYDVKYMK